MIISEYWQAKTLSELIEEDLTPYPRELGFVFAKINQAVVCLYYSHAIIPRNIVLGVILVALGSPVKSRLAGFAEANSSPISTHGWGTNSRSRKSRPVLSRDHVLQGHVMACCLLRTREPSFTTFLSCSLHYVLCLDLDDSSQSERPTLELAIDPGPSQVRC